MKEAKSATPKNTHRTHLPLDEAAGAKALPNANKVSTERTSKLVRMVGPGMTAVMVGLRAKRKSMRHVKVSITSSRYPVMVHKDRPQQLNDIYRCLTGFTPTLMQCKDRKEGQQASTRSTGFDRGGPRLTRLPCIPLHRKRKTMRPERPLTSDVSTLVSIVQEYSLLHCLVKLARAHQCVHPFSSHVPTGRDVFPVVVLVFDHHGLVFFFALGISIFREQTPLRCRF